MKKRRTSYGYESHKDRRVCICPKQPHITSEDVRNLIKDEAVQLPRLSYTFQKTIEGLTPYRIREMFQESRVPFRHKGCPRNTLSCCGTCTRECMNRCPQDVVYRAKLACGNILYAKDEETRKYRYQEASTQEQMFYQILTSDNPSFEMLLRMVTELISPRLNEDLREALEVVYNNENSPHRLDYAPVIEEEAYIVKSPDGSIDTRYRKKINPETGEASILNWPASGLCPYCLPQGMIDRRRTVGDKNRRKSKN